MIQIRNRFTGAVICESATAATVREAVVEAVVKARDAGADADLAGANLAGADLARANLARAYLAGANLAGADLAGAYLARADLAGANLADADLAGANLARADLAGANLADADLAGANLADADLADADLAGAYLAGAYLAGARNVPSLPATSEPAEARSDRPRPRTPSELAARFREHHPEVPVVESLDTKILDAITGGGGSLDMSNWHTCETTHCRAGWAITLAGEAGRELERARGPFHAGAMIYRASTGRAPHFFATDAAALEDIRRCAELERAEKDEP